MAETLKISTRQFTILATLITIGDNILVLPAIPALEANRDAWISAIVGLVIGLIFVSLFVTAGKLNYKLSLIEHIREVFGRWVSIPIALLFIGYIMLSISAHLREVGDFAVSQIIPDTPIEAVHILFLLLIIMGVRLGLETFTRVSEIFFPWFILLFIIFIVSLIPAIDLHKIQPVFDHGIKPILRGSIACTAFPFLELVTLMMIFPSVNNEKDIRSGIMIGTLIGGMILVVFIGLTILVLGAEPAARNTYPSYDLAKRINIGNFFQRVEAILALMWIITTYFKMTFFTYVLHRGLAQLFQLKDFRMMMFPIGMIIIFLSQVIAPNIAYYNNFSSKYWPYMDLTFSMFLPLALIVGYALRKNAHPKLR